MIRFSQYPKCSPPQIGILRVAMGHAQMNRIGWRELAHRQTYSSSDAYGERRNNEQVPACESVGMANKPANWNLSFLICHHNSNHRSPKNNRCESYKQEFKPMQYCSCHCQLRIIVIPIQIKTIRRCKCDKYYHYNRTQWNKNPSNRFYLCYTSVYFIIPQDSSLIHPNH